MPDPDRKAREARMSHIISQVTVENKPKVMIIQESQVSEGSSILTDLNCLLKNGEVPDMFNKEKRGLMI